MTSPVVSVIIPNYRGGTLLREAIASVQAQTLRDIELIVVSDGCEEDLSDISAGDPRVRLFAQPNRGVSIARNVGVRLARADRIAFLDDDDRMLPGRLQAQVEAMERTGYRLCHTQFRLIDGDGNDMGPGGMFESQYRDFLQEKGKILISSTMMDRDLFLEVGGFNPLLPLAQDLDLLYRVARETTLCFLPEVLTEYRRHEANTWSGFTGGDERRLILSMHLAVAKSRGETENIALIRRGMSRIVSDRVGRAISDVYEAQAAHRYGAMIVALARSFVLAPRFTVEACVKRVSPSG